MPAAPGRSTLCAGGCAPTPSAMSTLTSEQLTAGRSTAGEVIAGLVNDGSALPVARAAVHEAVTRHRGVRFVQVVARTSTPRRAPRRTRRRSRPR